MNNMYERAEELMVSWVNGNRNTVVKELAENKLLFAAFIEWSFVCSDIIKHKEVGIIAARVGEQWED